MISYRLVILDSKNQDNIKLEDHRRVFTDKIFTFNRFDISEVASLLIDGKFLPVLSDEDKITFSWTGEEIFTVYVNGRPKCQLEKMPEENKSFQKPGYIIPWCFEKIRCNLSIADTKMVMLSLQEKGNANATHYISYLLGQLRAGQDNLFSKRVVDTLHLYHLYITNPNKELFQGLMSLYVILKAEEDGS